MVFWVKVVINERSGQNGRGKVIQDVHAHPSICMDRIRDLKHYSKMVPKGELYYVHCFFYS
jgi:hypothetical protein